MVVTTDSLWDALTDVFEREYEAVVVYSDEQTVIHEGPARLLANGWVELPSGRLLSPNAVHHVDPGATE